MTLFVGTTTTMTSIDNVTITRPNGKPDPVKPSIYCDLLATGPVGSVAKGVQIDVKPSTTGTTNDDHSGAVINCTGTWQPLSAGSGNPMWGHGRGVIFYKDGRVAYERWFVDAMNRSNAAVVNIAVDWRNYQAFVVSAYTNPDGTGEIALYSATGLGGTVLSELWRTSFATSESVPVSLCVHQSDISSPVSLNIGKGDYAAGFTIGEGHTASFRPRAIFN